MKIKGCCEKTVDKRIIECSVAGHIEVAVIEDGKLQYCTYYGGDGIDARGIDFQQLFPGLHLSDIKKGADIDVLLGFLLSIKFALD